ncbi:HAD-superfamily hydrolase [Spiroplasma clarkii]|uniref:HAD-IIB family hydrolase n=1 Tax=Spiroplasma clarkii TaxID=2139 RepID=UPI000B55DCEB|nr:HAD-IIB family hydrolase [Spiroplasma clarkii]ARU90931.1 HAD-superfamily hydrolase [Spiroplasma clarkii]
MKWWFSDYDGTINIHHNDEIETKDLRFIKKWIETGNKFAIATGKMHHEIAPVLAMNKIPYDYMICNNGAIAYGKDQGILYHTPILMSSRAAIMDKLKVLQTKYILGYCTLDARKDYSYVPTPEIDDDPFFANAPKCNNLDEGAKDILNNPDLNLIYVYLSLKDVEKVKDFLQDIPGCKVVRTHKNVLEVMDASVSKAHGIKEIQKIHKFKIDDVIASGDGKNDIEMLQITAKAFTMTNHQKMLINMLMK